MARKGSSSEEPLPKLPPTFSAEARESQLIALAYDLAEKRLRDGTASAAETVHLLKAGTIEKQQQIEKLRRENMLLEARTEQLGDESRLERLLDRAMEAFAGYRGEEPEPFEDSDDY